MKKLNEEEGTISSLNRRIMLLEVSINLLSLNMWIMLLEVSSNFSSFNRRKMHALGGMSLLH